VSERDAVYTSDRDYAIPGRAHHISFETGLAIVFLIVVVDAVFPPP
jgi:hypothetical protein